MIRPCGPEPFSASRSTPSVLRQPARQRRRPDALARTTAGTAGRLPGACCSGRRRLLGALRRACRPGGRRSGGAALSPQPSPASAFAPPSRHCPSPARASPSPPAPRSRRSPSRPARLPRPAASRHALIDRLDLHRRLVGLDLGDDVARLHLVADLHMPLERFPSSIVGDSAGMVIGMVMRLGSARIETSDLVGTCRCRKVGAEYLRSSPDFIELAAARFVATLIRCSAFAQDQRCGDAVKPGSSASTTGASVTSRPSSQPATTPTATTGSYPT